MTNRPNDSPVTGIFADHISRVLEHGRLLARRRRRGGRNSRSRRDRGAGRGGFDANGLVHPSTLMRGSMTP